MKSIFKITPLLIVFIVILPTVSLADQSKVTRTHNGDTKKLRVMT
jgi:hypothetical protein